MKKDSITSLRILKVLVLKNDSIKLLWLSKFFEIAILLNAGKQPFLKFACHIILMINELHLLWVPNFITLGIYFPFGTEFSWNEETHTCFNVERVLLGRNFDVLGGYLVVNVRYLMVTTGYWSLSGGYSLLLVVTARYHSLLLVPTFSLNGSGNTLDENN